MVTNLMNRHKFRCREGDCEETKALRARFAPFLEEVESWLDREVAKIGENAGIAILRQL